MLHAQLIVRRRFRRSHSLDLERPDMREPAAHDLVDSSVPPRLEAELPEGGVVVRGVVRGAELLRIARMRETFRHLRVACAMAKKVVAGRMRRDPVGVFELGGKGQLVPRFLDPRLTDRFEQLLSAGSDLQHPTPRLTAFALWQASRDVESDHHHRRLCEIRSREASRAAEVVMGF